MEGGSQTHGGLFDARLVDKVYAFIAPMVIGGTEALHSVGGRGASTLARAPHLTDIEFHPVGQDLLVTGYPSYR